MLPARASPNLLTTRTAPSNSTAGDDDDEFRLDVAEQWRSSRCVTTGADASAP